jgi:Glycosyl hydrolases family 28
VFDQSRRAFFSVFGLGGLSSPPENRLAPAGQPTSVQNVRAFGAMGNGKVLETGSIQRAVDACSDLGGGVVYFPPGSYLTGTIFLKGKVSLYLEAGATLLGSTQLEHFRAIQPRIRSYTDEYVQHSLIYAEDVDDIGIAGRGVIDGQGAAFKDPSYRIRPYLLRIVSCRNVSITDITLKDSPMWVQHYLACENVNIEGITVRSRVNINNDGIDIDASSRVRISNCDIWSGDDAIVLKSTLDRPCRDVTVTNCVLSSLGNAFKLGTESVGGFENISFSNTAIYGTNDSAVALETVDGGHTTNIAVENLTIRDTRSVLFIRLGNRARPPYNGARQPGVGSLKHIVISNLEAEGADEIGCSITGVPKRAIGDVSLSDIMIRFKGAGRIRDLASVGEEEKSYPEYKIFGPLPAFGLYCRHVKNIWLSRLSFETIRQDARPDLVFDDVEALSVSGLHARSAGPVTVVRNLRDALFTNILAPNLRSNFLHVQGEKSARIRLVSNGFPDGRQSVKMSSEVPVGTVLE